MTTARSLDALPLEPVKSSALAAIGYEDGVLYVQFPSAHVFAYHNVPISVWEAFQAVPSKGAFWNAEIKRSGQFPAEKVTGTCVCGDIGLLEQTCSDCGTATYQK